MPSNTTYLSADTTNFSNISLYGDQLLTSRISSTGSILGANVWGSFVSATYGRVPSGGSLDVAGQFYSGFTAAVSGITNGASIASNQVIWTFGASGTSLCIRSGNTIWIIGSTVSAAATG